MTYSHQNQTTGIQQSSFVCALINQILFTSTYLFHFRTYLRLKYFISPLSRNVRVRQENYTDSKDTYYNLSTLPITFWLWFSTGKNICTRSNKKNLFLFSTTHIILPGTRFGSNLLLEKCIHILQCGFQQ